MDTFIIMSNRKKKKKEREDTDRATPKESPEETDRGGDPCLIED